MSYSVLCVFSATPVVEGSAGNGIERPRTVEDWEISVQTRSRLIVGMYRLSNVLGQFVPVSIVS